MSAAARSAPPPIMCKSCRCATSRRPIYSARCSRSCPKDATLQIDATRNVIILTIRRGRRSVDHHRHGESLRCRLDRRHVLRHRAAANHPRHRRKSPTKLTTIFGPKSSVPLPGMLGFAPLERMNAILVVSPQRAYVEQARMWIERLDRGEATNKPHIYEYHVQNSRASDVAHVLDAAFHQQSDKHGAATQAAPGTSAVAIGNSGFGGLGGAGGNPELRRRLGSAPELSSSGQPSGMLGGGNYGPSSSLASGTQQQNGRAASRRAIGARSSGASRRIRVKVPPGLSAATASTCRRSGSSPTRRTTRS